MKNDCDSFTDWDRIYYYASIYNNGAFFIFGGMPLTDTIGRLDEVTRKWSLAGYLKKSRYGHGVVYDGSVFLIVGGVGKVKSENCSIKDSTMQCIEHGSSLSYYAYYPALFMVDSKYGDDCRI